MDDLVIVALGLGAKANKRIDELRPSEAVLYIEQTLSDDEKEQARNNIGIKSGFNIYNKIFNNGDLIDNILNVNHDRNSENVVVVVYNNENKVVIPTDVHIISNDEINIDFTDIVVEGEWKVIVQGGDVNVSESSNVLLYTEQTLTDAQKLQVKNNLSLTTDFQNIYDAIPVNLSELINDSGFITNTVNNLTNYYTISQVDNIVAALSQTLSYEVVDILPTTDIKTNVIYLMLVEGSTNNYKMNMYISDVWYVLGETAINLSDYVLLTAYNSKMTEIDESLNNKQDVMTQKNILDNILETNTEYTINASSNIIVADANGWGVININATNNIMLIIPNTHKWAEGLDGYIENGTQVMALYDNGRWSRIDWR